MYPKTNDQYSPSWLASGSKFLIFSFFIWARLFLLETNLAVFPFIDAGIENLALPSIIDENKINHVSVHRNVDVALCSMSVPFKKPKCKYSKRKNILQEVIVEELSSQETF